MEYRVDGIIKFQEDKLRLAYPPSFNSSSRASVILSSTKDNDLAAKITLDADSAASAKEVAEIELNRIAGLISYFYDLPISEVKVTRTVSISVTSEGNIVPTAHLTGHGYLTAKAFVVHGLEPKSVEELRHHLGKKYLDDFEDIASMWREAISTESPALKYLLLYRLMEFLFRSNAEELTNWINAKEPSVQILHDRKRGDTTIYTHLRDNIHPKQKKFPLQDINSLLPRLQSLVKDAIEEKSGHNYAL